MSPSERSGTSSAESFGELFEEHYMRLRGALTIACRDPLVAEELSQEAFARVWERWDRVSALGDPVGYLYRVGMNLARDQYRVGRRVLRRDGKGNDATESSPPGGGLDGIETMTALEQAVLRLPARQRAALVVTVFLGYDSTSAARILNIRPGTVRRLASLARGRLAAEMMEDTDG